jgi:hypothetical protein
MKQIPVYKTFIYQNGEVLNMVPPARDGQEFIDRTEYERVLSKYLELEKNYWELRVKTETKKSIFDIFKKGKS